MIAWLSGLSMCISQALAAAGFLPLAATPYQELARTAMPLGNGLGATPRCGFTSGPAAPMTKEPLMVIATLPSVQSLSEATPSSPRGTWLASHMRLIRFIASATFGSVAFGLPSGVVKCEPKPSTIGIRVMKVPTTSPGLLAKV